MAFGTVVYSTHRWDVAPAELRAWIEEEHGPGPWVLLATIPSDREIPKMRAAGADPDAYVQRAIPGGIVVAWPPKAPEEDAEEPGS